MSLDNFIIFDIQKKIGEISTNQKYFFIGSDGWCMLCVFNSLYKCVKKKATVKIQQVEIIFFTRFISNNRLRALLNNVNFIFSAIAI